MLDQAAVTTFLFTDIEGSTRLWEQEPERMRLALARHDALVRKAVEDHGGLVVKTTGDGIHAAFGDPANGVAATLDLQRALADPAATGGIALRVRCGLHAGVIERRDNDFFGSPVNRAARIMGAAHGGQMLVSHAVAELVRDRLPDGVSLRDLGAVRLRDLSGRERIWQVIAAGLRHEFPALRSLEAAPNNLPQQVTTFVGREHEIVEVRKLLSATRLLTLCGMGGLGKTRLSLQVAADVVNDYPDGVWFVELASLTDERLVPQAVASVLGVKEEAGRPVTEALMRYVKDRTVLLLLDNCEHLVRACAELAVQLLQSGPHVKILASSREGLHVRGETTYPVPVLAVPDPERKVSLEALLRYESVGLFADRAAAAQPQFRLTEANAAAVTEICQRLDGIPLAIELAAARLRALSVESIAARLDDRFRLLGGGDRTALPRQQTLRALIDWSYDLLTDTERILFRRLAVFSGGWTLEAAEAVCAGGEIQDADVLDLLTQLVDKSLAVVESQSGRYRLLETVRQYAGERLRAAGEEADTRSRHLAHFLAFSESAGPGLAGPEQQELLKRIDADRENVLAAHAHCIASAASAESAYRLVHAIKHYWFIRGLLDLGHRITAEAIAVPDTGTAPLPRCRALWVGGQISSWMGRYDEARRYLEEGLALARSLDEPRMIVSILNTLSLADLAQGDRESARTHGREALDLATGLANKRGMAVASNALAQIHRHSGELDAAEPLYAQTVALGCELGDREVVAVGQLNLAMVAVQRGDSGAARGLLREVLAIAVETGSKPAGQSALEVASGLAALRREWEVSARFFGTVERQTGTTGIRRDPADEAFVRPLLAATRAALGDERFARALDDGRALDYDAAIARARAWLASAEETGPGRQP